MDDYTKMDSKSFEVMLKKIKEEGLDTLSKLEEIAKDQFNSFIERDGLFSELEIEELNKKINELKIEYIELENNFTKYKKVYGEYLDLVLKYGIPIIEKNEQNMNN